MLFRPEDTLVSKLLAIAILILCGAILGAVIGEVAIRWHQLGIL